MAKQVFNHYHVKIDADAVDLLSGIDKEELQKTVQEYGQFVDHLVKVDNMVNHAGPRNLVAWASAFAVAAVSTLIVAACLWGISWFLISFKGWMGW